MPSYTASKDGKEVTFEAANDEDAQAKLLELEQQAPELQKSETRDTGILGGIDAAVRGAADVATFGQMDEISAWLASKTGIGGEAGKYEQNLGRQRAIDQFDEEHNPIARGTGQVAGGVAAAVAGPAMVSSRAGLGLAGRALAGAGEGAAGGALYGFGSGEGGAEQRGQEALRQSVPGAAFGAAGAAVAPVLNRWAGSLLEKYGIKPAAPAPRASGDEFQVPLTRGQELGDDAQQRFEWEARNSMRGGPAQATMQGFEATQDDALRAAEDNIAGGFRQQPNPNNVPALAGQIPPATRDLGALGEQTRDAIRGAERKAWAGVDQAYEDARKAGTSVHARGVEIAPQYIRETLATAPNPVLINKVATPIANDLMDQLDEFGKLGGVLTNRAQNVQRGPDDKVVGVTLDGIEYMRRLITNAGHNLQGPDGLAVKELRGAFDKWEQDVAERALLDGSPDGLKLFKAAREARSRYGASFESATRQADDDAGRLMDRMVNKDATADEVVNAITGTSEVGAKGSSVRLVKRLQGVLPPEQMGTIRQMAWEKMLTDNQGGRPGNQAVAANIRKMLNNSDYAQALYTPQQRALMGRYAALLEKTVPNKNVPNWSGTASPVARVGQALAQTFLGAGAAGATYAATQDPALSVLAAGAGLGVKAARGSLNWGKAKAATRPLPAQAPGAMIQGDSFRNVPAGTAFGAASAEREEPQALRFNVRPGAR